MKKYTMAALASALCLLQAGLPAAEFSAIAASEAPLTYGVLNYRVEDGCVTITGCDAKVESVEIPTEIDEMPVTKIDSTAFYGCALTSVTIPEGVTNIASGAFWHSKNLAEVSLPSTLTTIEGFAFNDCQSLEKINFPESLTSVGNSAFTDTPWLAAQKEQSPFVVVNHILIDATDAVSDELAIIQEQKEKEEQEATNAKIWKRAGILTNQVGYFTNLNKKATLLAEETEGVKFDLLDADGNVVYSGVSQPFGLDKDSGDYVHVLDFSEFKTEGTYTLKSENGKESRAFEIGITDNYSGLLYDALNYFYQNRSGIAIEEQYITSGETAELARAAGHEQDIGIIQRVFNYNASTGEQDVTGGWYDAGDHGKYVVNGGISLWLMQNQYERAVLNGTAAAYQDGTMKIPENGNQYPDLLDEARYEMEWMLKMIVQDGECQGMAYHKVHDDKWTALGTEPAKDAQKRIIMPPSTAATLNLAACGAQAYRLWKDIDAEFAEKCLTAAKTAYEAAKAHPDMYAPNKEYGGGGAYNDDDVTDEFYWAACELYTSTGEENYYTDLKESESAFSVPSVMGELVGSFDWGHTSALGSLTLLLHQDLLTEAENSSLQQNLTATADKYLQMENAQGYGLPYEGENYPWASNSFVSDNAIILAYAYDMNQNAEYLNGAVSAMDYILGRNALDYSYVTGYGVHSAQYPHHRFWAKSIKPTAPKAPCGVMVGGANNGMEDEIVQKEEWDEKGTPPQKCYLDNIEAYSVNECAINWNSSLAWITGYLCEQNDGIIAGQPSAGTQIPEVIEPEKDPNAVDPLKITIPDGVARIGEQIFGSYANSVTEVVVPDSVITIGKQAFFQCKNLESITLPDTIELVGEKAFAETPWLAGMLENSPVLVINGLLIDGTAAEGELTIPEGVTSILGNAFYMNTKLTSVVIPEGVDTIGENAFNGCAGLTTVQFPKSLETIRANAFADTGLTELSIPEGVKEIGKEAFINCKSLPDVQIHNTGIKIGAEAFGCTSTFTASGQYSYVFIHRVTEDFVVRCSPKSTAENYAATTGVQTEYYGDVDRNKEIDILDVIALNRNILGKFTMTEVQHGNADTNMNGKTDPDDALTIMKYIVKIITSF